MNPGIQVRLEEKTMDALRFAMDRFLPKYVEQDLPFPSEYSIPMHLFFMNYALEFKDIKYEHEVF